MSQLTLFALFVALAACGSGADSPDGTGAPLPSVDAVWMRFGAGDYEMKLTDFAGACQLEQEGVSHKASSTYTAFHFALPDGDDELPANRYPVAPSGTQVQIEVKTLDDQCNTLDDRIAQTGTFVLTDAMSETAGAISGNYQIDFVDGTAASGSFQSAPCTLPATPPPGTCVP